MKFRQINEDIDYILQGETEEERIVRGKAVIGGDPSFITFMKMGTDPSMKLLGLPEGAPDVYEPDIHIPDGISNTTARQELRRIKSFLPGGSYANLKPVKKENVWIQILEGVHWKEAEVLTEIKDQLVLKKYPKLGPVLEALGVIANINSIKT